jgi:hypothetical protein
MIDEWHIYNGWMNDGLWMKYESMKDGLWMIDKR